MPEEPRRNDTRIVELDEIDSTNAEAQRLAAKGERGPVWIAARRQTLGRGRSGRSWASADGSLAATLLFRPDAPITRVHELSLVAGLGAYTAISETIHRTGTAGRHVSTHVRLKWPNDVLIDGAKVTGILVESTTFGSDIVAMIGIGTNVGRAPDLADRRTTGLAEHGASISPFAFAQVLADAISHWLATWQNGRGFPAIRAAWLDRAGPEGEPMTVNSGEGRIAGTFVGLDTDGALLLLDAEGRRRRFSYGDVTLGAATEPKS